MDSLDNGARNGEAKFHDDSQTHARQRKASHPKESSEEKESTPADYTSEQLAAVKRLGPILQSTTCYKEDKPNILV